MAQADDKPDTSEIDSPPAGPSPDDSEGAPEEAAEDEDESEERPTVTRAQAIFRMVVVTLALLALVEVGVRTAFYFHRKRVNAALEADYPPATYIADFTAKVDYRFINLYTIDPERAKSAEYDFDSYGFRLDRRKLRFDAPIPFKKIWMFGGSTVQGLGVRADETVAAHLNQRLEDDHSAYRVINMGQGGFTSTQELLLIVELLQAGQRPDAILCFDGENEVPFVGDVSKNGSLEWEKSSRRTALLGDVQGDETVSTLLSLTLSRLTRTDDAMRAVQRRMCGGGRGFDADNWDVVVRRHLMTQNLIKGAADQVKAPSFFFFQPVMEYEEHYAIRKLDGENHRGDMVPVEYKRRDAMLADSLADLRGGLGDHFFDIHDVFRGHDGETLYADPRHPNGVGNGLIAARIYAELKKLDASAK